MGSLNRPIPAFIDKTVSFPDGRTYEILNPLTDYRKCHDGRPLEARIVFTCKQTSPPPPDNPEGVENEYVMKVKVQSPDPSSLTDPESETTKAHPGPSTTTTAELRALKIFTDSGSEHTPHLITFKTAVQGPTGPLPGGYLTYMVMTKMPGQDLLACQFWGSKPEAWREEVVAGFLTALRSIYAQGIEPVDCALRNVLWEERTKKCSIIDFELWREATGPFEDERKELERWGLARRKAPISWWAEWKLSGH